MSRPALSIEPFAPLEPKLLEVAPTREADRTADEEAALLARVAGGDPDEALVVLYRRYARRVYGLGRAMLPDLGMAEELVQDTFVRLWQSAARFDPSRGTVRLFLFGIARRAAVDLLRRPASRPLAVADATDRRHELSDPEFAELVYSIEVREALNELSPKHREILELLYDADLTQRQAADRLELPLGTVKTRSFHALRALKAKLDERQILV